MIIPSIGLLQKFVETKSLIWMGLLGIVLLTIYYH